MSDLRQVKKWTSIKQTEFTCVWTDINLIFVLLKCNVTTFVKAFNASQAHTIN
jgi:hypothetical protein